MNLFKPIFYINRLINLDYIRDIYSESLGTLHSLQQTFDAAVHFLRLVMLHLPAFLLCCLARHKASEYDMIESLNGVQWLSMCFMHRTECY